MKDLQLNLQLYIEALQKQRNDALNRAAILASQVKDLQAKLKAKDEQIVEMAEASRSKL